MKSLHIRDLSRPGLRLATCALVAILVAAAPVFAQTGARGAAPPPAAPAPKVEERKDALGRETPRGTLLGFMRAARGKNDEAASHYLNTDLAGAEAFELSRELYVVLDSRLPARLSEVSNSPEGSLANPLRPDQDVVGTISTANGPLELIVERVSLGTDPPVWLFSQRTLEAIPEVFDEIDVVPVDVPRLRIGGVRLFVWGIVLLIVPLWHRLTGLARIPGVLRLLTLALAIHWVVPSVDFPLRERQLWTTVSAFLTLISGVWLLLHLNDYGARYVGRHFQNASLFEVTSLVRLGHRIADVFAVVFGVLVALRYFGMDPTAALAGLGIGGIAVALAAQKTLENVIGGLSLIFDKAVRVGDVLKVGDAAGTVGVVDSIGLRSTRIRTTARTILTVPNGQIANVSLETLSARDMCWFYHTLGLRFGTTSVQIRKVIEGIRDKLAAHPAVDASTVRVRFIRFAPSSLDVEVFAYVLTGDWPRFLEIQEQLLVSIMDIVERAGTSLAFPTQTLHLSDSRATPALEAGSQQTRRV